MNCCVALEANGNPSGSFDRQRVHVRPQRHGTPGLAAPEHSHHAGPRHTGAHLQSQAAQVLGDQLRRPRFLVRQFRVLVDVSAPLDHLLLDGRRTLADFRFQGAPVCPYRIRSRHKK